MGEQAEKPLWYRATTTILFGILSAATGYFAKKVLEVSGILDSLAAFVGQWLRTHVEVSLLGWIIGLIITLALWGLLLWKLAPLPSRTATRRPKADDRAHEAAIVAMIEALYDPRYFHSNLPLRVTRQMLLGHFHDTAILTRTGQLPSSARLADVVAELRKQGLLATAEKEVIDKIHGDWHQIGPNAKETLLRLGGTYPFLDLRTLPPLRPDEEEIARIDWSIADTLFRRVRADFEEALKQKGFDLQRRDLALSNFKEDVDFYAERISELVRTHIEIDMALVQSSLEGGYQRVENLIRARARTLFEDLLEIINEVGRSFENTPAFIEHFSRPIQAKVDPLVTNPLAVGTSPDWLEAVKNLKEKKK